MSTYRSIGNPYDLVRRAEEGVLPIIQQQPGYRSYSLSVAGDEIISLSVWNSREEAEAVDRVISTWVQENMGSEIELIETKFTEVLVGTALGITTHS